MGIVRLPAPRAVLAVLTVAASAIPMLLASPSQAQAFEPSVTPVPHEDLADGQQIAVHGSGFVPDEPVLVSQCADVPHGGTPPCDVAGGIEAVPDVTGNFSVQLVVHSPMTSNVTTPEVEYDCGVVQCYVGGSQNGVTAMHSLFFAVPQGTLSGTVRDPNGQPLPGAQVQACLAPGEPGNCNSGVDGFANTDAGGDYALDLSPGVYNAIAVAPNGGFSSAQAQVTITEDETTNQDFSIIFGTVSGTVRDPNGEPVAGAQVAACPAPGSPGPACFQGLTNTDAAGHYTIRLRPGTYNVAAVHGPVRSPDATVTILNGGTPTQDFILPLGKVSGTVLDGNGQSFPAGSAGFGACPAPGAAVFSPGARTASADAAGDYTLRLGAGSYNVAGFTTQGGINGGAFTPVDVAVGETITCHVRMPNAPVCGGDDDGVPDAVEDGAPNGGDGNNDGVPDSEQANVTSLPNAANGQYMSVESPDGTSLVGVSAAPVPGSPAPLAGATFPVGLLDFQVEGVAVGGTTTVTLHFPSGSSPNGYFKLHDGAWLDFSANAAIGVDQVTLTLTDGAVGDNDGLANGTIVDPGGPAVLPAGFDFDGFFRPVDNLPTVNSVKAGQAVPVKFSLGGDQGLDIFAADYPKSAVIPCESTALVDGVEQTVTAGGSSLSYDATSDTYTYVWKTSKSWASGTCRQLVLELSDGSVHRANFKFK
jgi:protocatechuate 3,4-dioxygenase beta subunit